MKTVSIFVCITSLVFFCFTPARADLADATWKIGQLVMWNNKILEGELAYNWSAETVLLRQADGHIRAYSAYQIRQFGWFDYDANKQRSFIALAGSVGSNREGQTFYEVYMDGPLTVVRRLRRPHGLLKRVLNHPANFNDQKKLNEDTAQFDYFVYDEGQFRTFDRFYADIYEPLLMSYSTELKHYTRIHNIDERTLLGRLIMVSQYNFLAQQDQKTASLGRTNAAQ